MNGVLIVGREECTFPDFALSRRVFTFSVVEDVGVQELAGGFASIDCVFVSVTLESAEQASELPFDVTNFRQLSSFVCLTEKAVKVFNEKLDNCCKSSTPRRKMADGTVPWWSSQLTNMRKKVMAAKKQLLRANRLHLADVVSEYVNTYRRLRNVYVSNIKKFKIEAW